MLLKLRSKIANQSINITEQSANKSDLQKSMENDTGSSDIVSFRNSNSSEKSNKSKDKKSKRSESKQTNTDRDICTYEESTSQQVCTYSNGVSIRYVCGVYIYIFFFFKILYN